MIPGSNLLNMALGVIGNQVVGWARFAGLVTNSSGFEIATFETPTTINGSFQPVPRNVYQFQGLDFTKNYANFYASAEITDILRSRAGDRLIYAGKTYTVESETTWFAQDGWTAVLCVELKDNA